MNEITDRIIERVQKHYEHFNSKQMELVSMRDSLLQSNKMMMESQAGWAKTALDSLASEIIKTCTFIPENPISLAIQPEEIEESIWNRLEQKKEVVVKQIEKPIVQPKNIGFASDKLMESRMLRFQGKIQKAIQVAQEAAELGSLSALTFLGYLYDSELKRFDESIKLYNRAADNGSCTGLALVGKAYY